MDKALKYIFFLLIVYVTHSSSSHAQYNLEDTVIIAQKIDQGQTVYLEYPDSAKTLWLDALKITQEILPFSFNKKMKKEILTLKSDLLFNLSQLYRQEGEAEKTIDALERALAIDIELDNQANISSSYNDLGVIYNDVGLFSKAVEYYLKSLAIDRKLGNQHGVSSSLINLGYLHSSQNNYREAIKFFNESLEIQLKENDTLGMIVSYNNLASVYYQLDQYDQSIYNARLSEKLARIQHNKSSWSNALSRIGAVKQTMNQLDSALYFYTLAFETRKKIHDADGMFTSLIELSMFHEQSGKLKQAIAEAEEAFSLAKKMAYPALMVQGAKQLSSLYNKTGNYQRAFDMQNTYITLNSELKDEDRSKMLFKKQFESEYIYKKQKDSLILLEQEAIELANKRKQELEHEKVKLEHEERHRKNRLYIYGSLFGLVIMLFVITLLIRNNRVKQRAKVVIEEQHSLLEKTHLEISDSINYARHLQKAIFPSKDQLSMHFKDDFVLFEPKDVVSGDFYWLHKVSDKVLFAVADCTGHGVPGAMVSVVCSNALIRCIKEFQLVQPADILNKARELIIETFSNAENTMRDGMDISLGLFHEQKLYYAGSNNSLWIVRKNSEIEEPLTARFKIFKGETHSIIVVPALKQPVGLHPNPTPFVEYKIELMNSDSLYMLTDGYADQFGGGGQKPKKFKTNKLKHLILEINERSFTDQKDLLLTQFNHWKGEHEQVDDVTIVGLKV